MTRNESQADGDSIEIEKYENKHVESHKETLEELAEEGECLLSVDAKTDDDSEVARIEVYKNDDFNLLLVYDPASPALRSYYLTKERDAESLYNEAIGNERDRVDGVVDVDVQIDRR